MRRDFFAGVEAVFTDMDGTLTTGGTLLPSSYAALARLEAAGIPVIVVTGRPAGWGDGIARLWPVAAVITENGGVSFVRDGTRRIKLYGFSPRRLPAERERMRAVAARVARKVRGAQLAQDSRYTEVNLAIDWNEDVHLGVKAAQRVESLCREAGYNAVRSSVHVNFWPGTFDKLTACREVLGALGRDARRLERYLYVGDALNDEPMFAGFPRSVGVANVREVWDELRSRPVRVTRAAEGRGFEEVARAVLRSQKG